MMPVIAIFLSVMTILLLIILVIFFLRKSCRRKKTGEMQESAALTPKQEETIRNIYGRLEAYFVSAQPYLDGSLTINDVARRLYTNKVYVSRAVNHCSGLNYCQYVNRYRVNYAVELFRKNPRLKIGDLAQQSGFNTQASFNMSFRLFMKESPRDWCRRVKSESEAGLFDGNPPV